MEKYSVCWLVFKDLTAWFTNFFKTTSPDSSFYKIYKRGTRPTSPCRYCLRIFNLSYFQISFNKIAKIKILMGKFIKDLINQIELWLPNKSVLIQNDDRQIAKGTGVYKGPPKLYSSDKKISNVALFIKVSFSILRTGLLFQKLQRIILLRDKLFIEERR